MKPNTKCPNKTILFPSLKKSLAKLENKLSSDKVEQKEKKILKKVNDKLQTMMRKGTSRSIVQSFSLAILFPRRSSSLGIRCRNSTSPTIFSPGTHFIHSLLVFLVLSFVKLCPGKVIVSVTSLWLLMSVCWSFGLSLVGLSWFPTRAAELHFHISIREIVSKFNTGLSTSSSDLY